MAQLNVKVTGAPDGSSQPVTLDVVQQGSESVPFVIFPTTRLTDGSGWVNFINLQPGQKIGPLLAAASSQKAVTPANQPVLFDGSADVTIELAYAPFKQPLPRVPSREEVCHGQLTAQGVTIHSLVYGDMPWWPACWAWLTKEDRAHIAPQLLALGDTIMLIDVPSELPLYDESDQFYAPTPQPNYPLANFGPLGFDVAALKALTMETLGYGFNACWIFLDGDVSYDVACQQVETIAPAFGSLNQYVAYVPGWDGTWHKPGPDGSTGYTPEQVASFAARARAAGALYTGFEHGTGYMPVGEGGSDFQPGGHMVDYDFVLGEFDSGVFNDDVWQILGRFVRPYIRPAEQPSDDDPHPPFVLSVESARGPYFYHIFEMAMYVAVRGESDVTIAGWKARFEAMAPTARIC